MRTVPLGRTAILAVFVTAITFVAYSLTKDGVHLPLLSADRYRIEVLLEDAAGLRAANEPPVSVAGVQQGKVADVVFDGGRARAKLDLDPSARGRVFADATVRVRPQNGANVLAVDIQPGHPEAGPLPEGRAIPPARASVPIASDQVLGMLDADTRAYLGIVLGESAQALQGRGGDVARALARTGELTDSAAAVTRLLRRRRALTRSLVGELTQVLATAGRRREELRTALEGSDTLLRVAAADRVALASAVRAVPGLLDETDRTLDVVRAQGAPFARTLQRLVPAVRALAPALRATRSVLPDLETLLAGTADLTRGGGGALRDALALLRRVNGVRTTLVEAARSGDGAVRGLDAHARSLVDAGDFVSGLTSGQDDRSPIGRARFLGVEVPRPENLGFPAGTPRATVDRDLARALDAGCRTRFGACLLRVLTPGLSHSLVTKAPVVRRVRGSGR